jgi:hypothetical protein
MSSRTATGSTISGRTSFATRDFGKTWESLAKGLPADLPLWVVREDPDDPNYLYLGTDRGIWYSKDAGKNWKELRLNLPAVTVTDLEVKHGDLVAATRGRSFWALEDLAALRAMKTPPTATTILSVAKAYRFRPDRRWDYPRRARSRIRRTAPRSATGWPRSPRQSSSS